MFSPEIHPTDRRPFAHDDGMRASYDYASGSCTAGMSSNIDYSIAEDRHINGLQLVLDGHKTGDNATLQVLMGETVVSEFGSVIIAGDCAAQPALNLPITAKILAGLTIRIVYTSTGPDDVSVYANLFLYEKNS